MISTAQNAKPFNLNNFRSSLKPRRAINCVLVTISIVCVCAIAVVSAIVVRDWSLAKVYDSAVCLYVNATFSEHDEQHCSFCSGTVDKSSKSASSCTSVSFPCLRITVNFKPITTKKGEDDPVYHEGLLYSDITQASGTHRQCSYSGVCHKTRAENARAVKDYADLIAKRKNTTFVCYYDTVTIDNVILDKVYSNAEVFHYLFWPSLVIVICGLIFLHMECHRKGLVVCPCAKNKAAKESNPTEKENGKELPEIGINHLSLNKPTNEPSIALCR